MSQMLFAQMKCILESWDSAERDMVFQNDEKRFISQAPRIISPFRQYSFNVRWCGDDDHLVVSCGVRGSDWFRSD